MVSSFCVCSFCHRISRFIATLHFYLFPVTCVLHILENILNWSSFPSSMLVNNLLIFLKHSIFKSFHPINHCLSLFFKAIFVFLSLLSLKPSRVVHWLWNWFTKDFFKKITRQCCLNKILHETQINKTVNLELFWLLVRHAST